MVRDRRGDGDRQPQHAPAARTNHFVTIGLVHDPARGTVDLGTGINHPVIPVESLDASLADLAVMGITAEPPLLPGGANGPRTSWITDPDGYRIELVQWPAGHADGITKPDFVPLQH